MVIQQNLDNTFKLPVSVHLILIEHGKVLLLKRQNTGFADGMYCLPCGRKEKDESITDALIREAKEEVGIEFDRQDIEFVAVIHKAADKIIDSWQSICFFATVNSYRGKIENMEPEKCSELKFFPVDELPQEILSAAKAGISAYYSGDSYLELDW